MISKELFVKTINRLKAIYLVQSDLEDFFREHHDILGDSTLDLGVTSDLCIDLLEAHFDIYNPEDIYGSTLSWWIYDCNFGEKFTIGDLTDGSFPTDHPMHTPDLSTPELLYDYLTCEK